MILPEEQELVRLEAEQAELEEQVATAELILETTKTETAQFQRRYYETVGRLYVQLDELDALIAKVKAGLSPNNAVAQAHAQTTAQQAKQSAEEAGVIESQPAPPLEITPELKHAFRKAAKLIHPDRATTELERLRRTEVMAKVNLAYETGNQQEIERLIIEFGQDPEAISGEDIASRIVKAIRRIAQLRRRMGETQQEMEALLETAVFQLKKTVEETEAMGGDPLGDLTRKITQELSERKVQLEMAKL